MGIAQTIVVLILAAAVGEGINEFFFLPWLDNLKGKWDECTRVQVMRLWSGLVGVGIAWELSLNVFGLLGAGLNHPLVGNILTGLLIGRGSNYVHALISRYVQKLPVRE